jgi:hypothetical protein
MILSFFFLLIHTGSKKRAKRREITQYPGSPSELLKH